MSLTWYARRLAAMSPPEISHRLAEHAKRAAARRRRYGWDRFDAPGPAPAIPGLADDLRAHAGAPFKAALRASVAALLDGRFSALGVDWPRRDPAALFPADLWRLDPVTGGAWPGDERFCFDIAYRHERTLGDVKYVWELNRLQFLQPLAAAAALFDDAAALAAIEAAIDSWAGANRPFGGLGWNSGIEIALRAVSLIVVASLCGGRLSAPAVDRIRAILAASLYWLDRYPSRFSSANNHLVAEATGLFLIAALAPDLPRAAAVADHARQVLAREAALQILPDGAPAEQSPTYGAFTAEMLTLSALTARRLGRPLAAPVDARLAAFAQFTAWLSGPDGTVPAIGDDDEGRVLTLAHGHEAAYPASVAALIAAYLDRPLFGPPPATPELRQAFFAPPAPAAALAGVKVFGDGGLSVVRERQAGHDLVLVMDHGPLGYLSIAAHGHADANAVLLAVDGRPVLVDPGTYLYHSGGPWRDWLRGTRAHNTLSIDGADQSLIAGPFNWSHKARAWRRAVGGDAGWVIAGAHDGYRKRFGVDHHRTVRPALDGLVIVDELHGAPDPEAELAFQLAPGLSAARIDGAWRIADAAGRPILDMIFHPRGRETALAGGGCGDGGGWVSACFGVKQPATRLSWRGPVGDGVTTRLRLP